MRKGCFLICSSVQEIMIYHPSKHETLNRCWWQLIKCWVSVVDGGPTLDQNRVIVGLSGLLEHGDGTEKQDIRFGRNGIFIVYVCVYGQHDSPT